MSDKKENVNIDELMQGLKRGNSSEPSLKPHMETGSGEDGKLVTRADGSKAIKVKKRKRRSQQPKKEAERKNIRNKVIFITSGIVMCLLGGIAFTVLLAYYNGTKYNEKLVSTLKSQSGAEIAVKRLEVSLGDATIHDLRFDWESPESTIDYAKFNGVTADYGVFSFFKGGWSGAEVFAENGEIRLNLHERPTSIKPEGESPIDFDFDTYKCRHLNATIGQDENWKLKDTQAEFSVNEKGEKQVYLYGGAIESPFFEEYAIRSGVVAVKPDASDVSLVLLSDGDRGSVTLAGKVGYKTGSKVVLKSELENVLLDDWMDHKVKRFINGKVSQGEGTLKMTLGDSVNKELVTHVESDALGITNFEFIQTLGLKMKNDYYARPTFESRSKMTIDWRNDRTVVKNIRWVEAGDFIITGSLTVRSKSGALSGKLRLGIPIVKLNASELLHLRKVFKVEEDEVIWTEVTLSGSVAIPKDDLASQFELSKGIKTEPKDSAEELFDSINQDLTE